MKEKIKKFIDENHLTFSDEESGLNGNCVILAGYICHLNDELEPGEKMITSEFVLNLIKESYEISFFLEKEFERVFNFAKANNYGNFWKTKTAKKQYIY
jgi:hypothetical protein